MQIVVYEPFQHFIPTGRGWSNGFKKLGHQSFELPSTQYSILELDQDVDILVLFAPDKSIVPDILQFKKEHPLCKIVFVCLGYKDWYAQIESCVSLWVEHTFKHDMSREQFEKRGLKFACIPLAADSTLFFPMANAKMFDIRDVSFVGQFGMTGHGDRDEQYYLYPVIDKYSHSFFGGFTYKGNRYPNIPHSSLNNLYNTTKINLNFHYPYQKDETPQTISSYLDFNGRVFEIAFSGNFQLCDHAHVKDIGFETAIPIGDKTNWLDMIEHYLKNDDLRMKCAAEARSIALNKHTWECRMEDVIKNL